MRRRASGHDGGASASCVQWTTDASSHQSNRCGIVCRCAPDIMKERIAASSFQSVRVQYTRPRSRSRDTARFAGVLLACQAERTAPTRKAGVYLQERTRKRVMDTNGMTNTGLLAPGVLLRRGLECGEAAIKIGDQVIDVLEADVKPDRWAARRPSGGCADLGAVERDCEALVA